MSEHTTPSTASLAPDHVPWLDGLRGIAALWVFLSHVQILSGMGFVPLVSWGGLAVDLFMMLSGFLMAHHYLLRQDREPWGQPATWVSFWLRRFFRIAPLYYLLLVVALAVGPWLGDQRDSIAAAWPHTDTAAERYDDQSVANLLVHMSFAFGMVPDYAFRTALPDWSIGLEMQFYLLFPLLMMMVARLGALRAGLVAIVACAVARALFPAWFQRFEMPAFLPMKLYVFFIGMWIALSRRQGRMGRGLVVSLLLAGAIAAAKPHWEAIARVGMVLALFYLMTDGSLPTRPALTRAVDWVRARLSGRVSVFLGDTAYGFYLVHLLVLLPVGGALARESQYLGWPAELRWLCATAIAGPIAYGIAWLLYRGIEQPGIRLGKAVVAQFRDRAGWRAIHSTPVASTAPPAMPIESASKSAHSASRPGT
jgi:peptidoglycan/LPS O-acetylase OafA/YrhL